MVKRIHIALCVLALGIAGLKPKERSTRQSVYYFPSLAGSCFMVTSTIFLVTNPGSFGCSSGGNCCAKGYSSYAYNPVLGKYFPSGEEIITITRP